MVFCRVVYLSSCAGIDFVIRKGEERIIPAATAEVQAASGLVEIIERIDDTLSNSESDNPAPAPAKRGRKKK